MKSKAKIRILETNPELWQDIEELIEDVKFAQNHLVPMKSCECGGEHIAIEGVMYRMCGKCRGIFAVRDEAFIKERGELPVDFDWELSN
jgi:hypothetical protein